MPEVAINLVAILVAAIANMVIGFIWYGPLFGRQWMDLMGLDINKIKSMKMNANKAYIISFIGALLMAYVLAHASTYAAAYYAEFPKLVAYLMTAFWSWLGFVMIVQLGSVLFENKPTKLFILNTGYQLVSLLVMGAILAMM